MRRTKRLTIIRIALALTVAAIIPVAAHAKPMPGSGFNSEKEYRLGPGEIPYLSQGQGLDRLEAEYRARAVPVQEQPVIPYLSHGQGVTSDDLGFTTSKSADDRGFARAPTLEATAVTSDGGGSSIDVNAYVISGFGIALLLVAVGMGLTIRHHRKGGLSPA